MKICVLGDTHFSFKRPQSRIDEDYFATQDDKLSQVLEIYVDERCSALVQVGDFFNSPDTSNFVIASLIRRLRRIKPLNVLCIYGQHDITGHSKATLRRSPLKVLEAAGVLGILDSSGYNLFGAGFHGISFGCDIPEKFPDIHDCGYNILVIHDMIGDRPLYPGQPLHNPETFLKRFPEFDLILCGDYHYRFLAKLPENGKTRIILNPGAMVRKTISKWDLEHEPAVAIIDTETQSVKMEKLKVKPIEEVFDLSRLIEKMEPDKAKLQAFIEKLKSSSASGFGNWEDALQRVYKEKKTSMVVKEIISSCMEEVK